MASHALPSDSVSAAATLPQSDHCAWTQAWLEETSLSQADHLTASHCEQQTATKQPEIQGEVSGLSKTPLWKSGSFDSQESTVSFRIPADHEGNVPCDRVRKAQLAVAMEQCTGMMKNMLLSPSQRPKMKEPVCALTPEMASVAASIAGIVSTEMQSATVDGVMERLTQNQKTQTLRQHQLKALAEEKRHPLLMELEGEARDLRNRLQNFSRDVAALKRRIKGECQERHRLISVREEIEIKARSLRDVGEKYDAVVKENRVLRGTIRELQGDVQVMLQLPYRAGSYLEATNRDEVSLTGKKKTRSFTVDGLLSGEIQNDNIHRCLSPLMTSALDGQDAMLVGLAVGEKSSFLSVVARTIDKMATMAEGHEMGLEIEVRRLTCQGSLTVLSKIDLPQALGGYLGGRRQRHQAILKFLREIIIQKTERPDEHPGHLVVELHVLQPDRQTEDADFSKLTFLQLQPPQREGWWRDPDVESVLSTLLEISAKRVPEPPPLSSSLLGELLEKQGQLKLYTLLLEVANAPGYQKGDSMALNLSHEIRSARVDGETKTRQRTARFLKKKIISSNEHISKITEQKIEITKKKETLLTEVDDLQSQIAALQEIKRNRQIRKSQTSISDQASGRKSKSVLTSVRDNGQTTHCRPQCPSLRVKSLEKTVQNRTYPVIRGTRNSFTAQPRTGGCALMGAVRDHHRPARKAQ